jgi:hypothetical protein
MGSYISLAIKDGIQAAKSSDEAFSQKPRSLKISSKGIPDFNGSADAWTKWRTSALNTLVAGGYKMTLMDRDYATEHTTDNEIVYTLLAMATIDGTARHMVTKYDEVKDGYAAWHDLTDLYDGSSRMLSTAKRLRATLVSTYLFPGGNSDRYIDVFLETYRDLASHQGHMTEQEAISLFLDNIQDPDYDMFKQSMRTHNLNRDMTLDTHVLQFRERSDDLNLARSTKRKLKQLARRMGSKRAKYDDADTSDDEPEIRRKKPSKNRSRARRTKGKPLEISPRPSGLLSLERQQWIDLSEEDRVFIQEYNAKVKHNEPTDSLVVPPTLTVTRARRAPTTSSHFDEPEESTHSVSESSSSSSSSSNDRKEKPPKQRKKIRFNLTETKEKED